MSPDVLELENKEIAKQYKQLLKISYQTLSKDDKKLIRTAFDTAVDAHKEQRRKSGEAYIFHPIAVAKIVAAEIGLDATSIAAALLHDVVEDTHYTLDDLERLFNKKVSNIVDGLTKISGVFDHKSSLQAENFRKLFVAMAKDVRVILVKLADRLHNMRTLGSVSENTKLKIASETLFIYAPLAHRLGLNAVKTEMEDLSLKFTNPTLYREISDKLAETKNVRQRYVKEFIDPLKNELELSGLNIVEIKGRPKSIYSIVKKMEKQQR